MFIDNGARTANTGTQGSRPSGARLPDGTCLGQLESDRQLTGSVPRTGARCTPRAEPRERTATSAEKIRQLESFSLSTVVLYSFFLRYIARLYLTTPLLLSVPLLTFHATLPRQQLEIRPFPPLVCYSYLPFSSKAVPRSCAQLPRSSLRLERPVRWRFVPERRENC